MQFSISILYHSPPPSPPILRQTLLICLSIKTRLLDCTRNIPSELPKIAQNWTWSTQTMAVRANRGNNKIWHEYEWHPVHNSSKFVLFFFIQNEQQKALFRFSTTIQFISQQHILGTRKLQMNDEKKLSGKKVSQHFHGKNKNERKIQTLEKKNGNCTKFVAFVWRQNIKKIVILKLSLLWMTFCLLQNFLI